MKKGKILFLVVGALSLSGCGYNTIQALDEEVSAAKSGISIVYQKRADLVPNLVTVVKAAAKHEENVFVQVARARSQASTYTTQAKADGVLTDDEMRENDNNQRALSSAIARTLVVAENYPELKSNQNFTMLQQQLVQIETQAAAARSRYVRKVREFNTYIRKFPTNVTASIFGHKVKPQLEFQDESSLKLAPNINFDRPQVK
jgi:LemA protein